MQVPVDGLSAGDKVRVIIDPRARINTAIVLYLIPVLLIVTGSFAGFFALPVFLGLSANLGSFVGVVAGILISFAFIHFYGGNQSPDQGIRIERISK